MAARDLRVVVRSSGFTPAAKEVEPLIELLSSVDDKLAASVERALARGGARALEAVMHRFASAGAPQRARLCGIVARAAEQARDPALVEWLFARVRDGDPKTRRRVFRVLGHFRGDRAEALLLEAFSREEGLPERRAIVRALGSAGGEKAARLLSSVQTEDAELSRLVREARAKLERGEIRTTPTVLSAHRAPAEPMSVLVHVRAGLEELLMGELDPSLGAREAGRGRVIVTLRGPLEGLWTSRLLLHFGFPLPPESTEGDSDETLATGVARAIAGDAAWRIFSAFTSGPIRYRVEWTGGGRRRSANWSVARAVSRARPELVNDPVDAPWEAAVTVRQKGAGAKILVELWPRGLDDPRFLYRRHLLAASSHPTIAAALARVGGVREDDVVWDPFVGAGTELIERAVLGPYARLVGSDSSVAALEAAADNLRTASVERAELHVGDARSFRPAAVPTLVLTNPPFGRRVVRRDELADLLDAAVANIARQLAPGGRFVWVSPMPRRTAEQAQRGGLSVAHRFTVDMGGFDAEVQAFRKAGGQRRVADRRKRP